MEIKGLGGVSKGVVPACVQAGEVQAKGWFLHENQRKSMKIKGLGGVSKGVLPACVQAGEG